MQEPRIFLPGKRKAFLPKEPNSLSSLSPAPYHAHHLNPHFHPAKRSLYTDSNHPANASSHHPPQKSEQGLSNLQPTIFAGQPRQQHVTLPSLQDRSGKTNTTVELPNLEPYPCRRYCHTLSNHVKNMGRKVDSPITYCGLLSGIINKWLLYGWLCFFCLFYGERW